VVNALARDHRVVVPSRRFHFPNAKSADGAYDFERHADDLAALIAALGLESADVAGEGYGAGVVLLAAQRHPQRIRRVVLIEPALTETLSDPKIAKALAERDRALFAEAAKAYKPDDPAAAMRPLVDALYGGGTFDAADALRRESWLDNAATLKLGGAATPGIGCEAAGAIAQPVLIVRGTRGTDSARAIGRAVERCMRKAQTLDIADAGPEPQVDQPASFVAGVAEFLK
jgi:pimeloyl-ACP methyl ester carboxylesterase